MFVVYIKNMSVLILKHVENEGAGTIVQYLQLNGITHKTVRLYKGDSIPEIDGYQSLVILGGPMSVNEEDLYPFITQELRLIEEAIQKDKRILGICLGAQLIAKALGSRVYRGERSEVGWCDIVFTNSALADTKIRSLAKHPKTGDLSQRIKTFQWHGETFDYPDGVLPIASSELYPNQAFRHKTNTYAFQFHVELTVDMINDWMKNEPIDKEQLAKDTKQHYEIYHARAINFYEAFFKG